MRTLILLVCCAIACSSDPEEASKPNTGGTGGTAGAAGAGGSTGGSAGVVTGGTAGTAGDGGTAGSGEGDAGSDAAVGGAAGVAGAGGGVGGADAGLSECNAPSQYGYNCNPDCTPGVSYTPIAGSGGLCPAEPGLDSICTNPVPMGTASPPDRSVLLPAKACLLRYVIEVKFGQCVKVTTSNSAWGVSTSADLTGGLPACLVHQGQSSPPDKVYVHGPMAAGGWIRSEWGSCPLTCP